MVNFGPLTAEISSGVWGTPANFNGFRVLAVLLQGTLVAGVSQTLWRWTDGTTYIRQGGHHVGHGARILVLNAFLDEHFKLFSDFGDLKPNLPLTNRMQFQAFIYCLYITVLSQYFYLHNIVQ